MKMQEKNMENLIKAIGNVEITSKEMKSLEWLSGCEPETVNNICNVLEKTKSRGAGRKKKVDVQTIQALKKEGKTQQETAQSMGISLSTVARNWKVEGDLKMGKMKEGKLGYNEENDRYGVLVMDCWEIEGLHCGDTLEVCVNGEWVADRIEMHKNKYYLVNSKLKGVELEGLRCRI